MRIFVFLLIGSFTLSGCVTLKDAGAPVPEKDLGVIAAPKKSPKAEAEDMSPELLNIKGEELDDYTEKKGVIFAKTDFRGLLETRYVKFLFQKTDDPSHTFQLYIGERPDRQSAPAQEGPATKPSYFFVELLPGEYRITSLSIPVGSTMATEAIDLRLEVLPGAICYVGTLKLVGTKERIKLGGVPLIKPGFEYTAEVLDERVEGIATFRQNYPNFSSDIEVRLMRVGVLPQQNI